MNKPVELERRWLPAQYQDEVIPPPRATPDDWIISLPGDMRALARNVMVGDDGDGAPGVTLRDGDIVEFDWTVALGRATLTVAADRTWTVDRALPDCPGACSFAKLEYDRDSMSDNVADLVEWCDCPGECELIYYAWSENSARFEFRGGRFHELAGGT